MDVMFLFWRRFHPLMPRARSHTSSEYYNICSIIIYVSTWSLCMNVYNSSTLVRSLYVKKIFMIIALYVTFLHDWVLNFNCVATSILYLYLTHFFSFFLSIQNYLIIIIKIYLAWFYKNAVENTTYTLLFFLFKFNEKIKINSNIMQPTYFSSQKYRIRLSFNIL
jgi:hypothetical protein